MHAKALRAADAERAVWDFVSSLLRDPKEIRRGMERLIEQERTSSTRDPEYEAEIWTWKIAGCARPRSAF